MTLTKTLKFDEGTLDILRNLQWSADGMQARITDQLDRAAYEQVNKALKAMGGKWMRKIGAHMFKTDPRAKVKGLLTAGNLTIEKDGFFETPPHVVQWMLDRAKIKPNMSILEPSAGMGAIVRPLWKMMWDGELAPLYFTLVEKNGERVASLTQEFDHFSIEINKCDFLDYSAEHPFDRILMNPPFEEGQDMAHVKHAYTLLAEGGILVSIMSEGVFSRTDNKAKNFRKWLALETDSQSQQLPADSFKTSGTGVNTRIVTIRKVEKNGG